MSSQIRTKQKLPKAQELPFPSPSSSPTHAVSSTTPTRKRTLAAVSSAGVITSQPSPKRINIEDQRRELTRSIISTLPRATLETLLLNAALRDGDIMQEVITVNSLKPTDIPSKGNLRDEGDVAKKSNYDQESLQDVATSELVDTASCNGENLGGTGGSKALSEDHGRSASHMDSVLIDGATDLLQFHHMTKAQFLARKTQIMELLRGSSPKESLSSDQG